MMRAGGLLGGLLALGVVPVAHAAPAAPLSRCVAAAEQGQRRREHGSFVDARSSFRQCAADECPTVVRRDCTQWLANLESELPSVVVGARDSQGNDVLGAHLLIDGEPHDRELAAGGAIPLDPGPHLFHFDHPPNAPVETTAVLRTGEQNRPINVVFGATPTVALAPSSPPPVATVRVTRVTPGAYVLGGIAAAGGASFALFGVLGENEKTRLRGECGNACSDAQVAPLKVKYIIADTSLALGVVAAAVSLWLFTHPTVREQAVPSVAVVPVRGGGSVAVVGRF